MDEIHEEPVKSPLVVLIDSAESQPFTFQGLRADAKQGSRPLIVSTRHECLGRHPHSLGDYTAEGLVGIAHVERKSREDCQGTVLGWETPSERAKELKRAMEAQANESQAHEPVAGKTATGRRDRFEKELSNLAKIAYGVVIVEASFGECLATMPQWGKKSRETNAKIFARSVSAYMQDYKVPWMFCDSRRQAEVMTFRFLERAHRKMKEGQRVTSQQAKEKARQGAF